MLVFILSTVLVIKRSIEAMWGSDCVQALLQPLAARFDHGHCDHGRFTDVEQ